MLGEEEGVLGHCMVWYSRHIITLACYSGRCCKGLKSLIARGSGWALVYHVGGVSVNYYG